MIEVGIWEVLAGVLATFASGATAWVFSRRQSKVEIEKLQQEVHTMAAQRESEVKSKELEIMDKYREFYNNITDDLGKQLSALKAENETVRSEVNERREITDQMRHEIRSLHVEIAQLRGELKTMKEEFPCVDCPRRSKKK